MIQPRKPFDILAMVHAVLTNSVPHADSKLSDKAIVQAVYPSAEWLNTPQFKGVYVTDSTHQDGGYCLGFGSDEETAWRMIADRFRSIHTR